jgi:drug/metabolite transporter (DMT)-like permease
MLGGAVVGSTFSIGLFLQLWGLQYTSPSTAAFLTSLVVVFTPIAQAVFQRRSPSRRTWLAVGIALTGIYILTNPAGGGFGLGELLNLISALAFTGQILTLDYYGRRSDAQRLTVAMFLTTALLNLVCFVFLAGSLSMWAGGAAAVAGSWTVQWTMVTAVVACTLIAFGLMNTYQPKVAPARAALIYCMEPVFAALFSIMLGAEPFTARMLFGGAVILAADALDLTGRAREDEGK